MRSRGFTLIELLIVIAVLGILAVIVLIAVNPAEQLRRGRDADRISTVTSLGRAVQAYYTVNGGYPNSVSYNWMGLLLASSGGSGDLKLPITNPDYSPAITEPCNGNGARSQNPPNGVTNQFGYGYCYFADPPGGSGVAKTKGMVYVMLESDLYNKRCIVSGTQYRAWVVWYSDFAKTGLWCTPPGSTNPEPNFTTNPVDSTNFLSI